MAYLESEENNLLESLVKDCKTYNDNVRTLKEGSEILNEGVWEKIKYGMSKLGRYKAGGKIMGKGKVDAAAAAEINAVLKRQTTDFIASLDAKIKEIDPEFPNNEHGTKFLQIIEEISKVYDSIVAATKLSSDDKGYLQINIANEIIEDLAIYVKKFLDVDLAGAYSTMDEQQLNEMGGFSAGIPPTTAAPAPTTAVPTDPAAAMRSKLQGKTPAGGKTRDSQRMNTLASNKLPLVLAGVGTALGGLGWLAQTDWLKDLIINWLGGGTPAEDAVYKTIFGGKADSQGFVHWASQIMEKPITNGAGVQEFIDKYGIENVQNMFAENGGGTVEEQGQKLMQLVGGENANKGVGELFNEKTFGDMKMGRNLFGISKAGSFVAKTLVKQAVKATAGAGAGVAATVAGVGSVLVPLGIGLLGAGALVKLMRMKGQKQSRAKTLNDLFQSLRPIDGTPTNEPIAGVANGTNDGGDNGSGATNTGGDNGSGATNTGGDKVTGGVNKGSGLAPSDNLFNQLKSFFQFIKNNENSLNTGKQTMPTQRANLGNIPRTNAAGHERMPIPGQGPDKIAKPIPASDEDGLTGLSEGKFITDKRTLEYLNKRMGSFDKIKMFEEFLSRLEIIRNILKKMGSTGDKVLDGQIAKLNANPIMIADFKQLFDISSNDASGVQSLAGSISEITKILYSGQYKFMNIIDKIATLGGGNINKVQEASGYNMQDPNKAFRKDSMTKESFKKNLIPFISELVAMFQYLYKKRKEAGTAAPQGKVQEAVSAMNEQAEKMRHLMNFNRNTKGVL